MKTTFILVKKLIITYFALVTLFFFTVVIACTIPSPLLRSTIENSLNTLKKEGTYPLFGLPFRQIILDNFTDALILNTAYSVDSKDPTYAAMTNTRSASKEDIINQITGLEQGYLNEYTIPVKYERYWHGYLDFVRPLLVFIPYFGIRIILTLLLYIGLFLFLFLCFKKLGIKIILALLFGFIFVDFFYLGQSIQFSSVFLIGIFGSIYTLIKHKHDSQYHILFFVVGALTSYFDLLTAPLVTLGLLIIVTTALGDRSIKKIVTYCILWSIGYLLLWFTKWWIVQTLYVPDAISNAFHQITDRTITQADANFSHFQAIRLNVLQLIGYNKTNKFVDLFLSITFGFFFLKYVLITKDKLRKIIPWICIGIIPYLWYLIAANHSYLHVWYTYRDQLMSVICFLLIAFELMDTGRFRRDIRYLRNILRFSHKSTQKHHIH